MLGYYLKVDGVCFQILSDSLFVTQLSWTLYDLYRGENVVK
jgi:hypothetical protein